MKENYCQDCGKRITPGKHYKCVKCFNKIPWNKGLKGQIPWNKGLTKETDTRVKEYSEKVSKSLKGKPIKIPVSEKNKKLRQERMLGDKNPAKRPDVRKKISQSILTLYKEHPEVLENRKSSGINQYSNEMTYIEQKIYNVLKSKNIMNIHNYRIGKYFADFLIFDNVIIECDGEYWHKDKEKDKRKDDYLFDRGYYVFRLSGKRINKDPIGCIDNILLILKGLKYNNLFPISM